jgi:hypothetical protein
MLAAGQGFADNGWPACRLQHVATDRDRRIWLSAAVRNLPLRIAIYGLLVFYVLCCAAALGLIHASEHRLWDLQPDPLAYVFAWALALPWSLLASLVHDAHAGVARGIVIAGMLLNVAWGVRWAMRSRDE